MKKILCYGDSNTWGLIPGTQNRFPQNVRWTGIDGAILMLGTNDCKTVYGASAEVIGKGVEQLINQIKQRAPQAKILLLSPILLGDDVWKPEYDPEFSRESVQVSKKLKDVYRRIAEKHNCLFLAASDVTDPSATDQEHLDEKGHERLADAIYEVVRKNLAVA